MSHYYSQALGYGLTLTSNQQIWNQFARTYDLTDDQIIDLIENGNSLELEQAFPDLIFLGVGDSVADEVYPVVMTKASYIDTYDHEGPINQPEPTEAELAQLHILVDLGMADDDETLRWQNHNCVD